MKVKCNKCGQMKDVSEFRWGIYGPSGQCIDCRRTYQQGQRERLSNGYVRNLIFAKTGIPIKDIPDDYVEVQKTVLTAKRELKKQRRIS